MLSFEEARQKVISVVRERGARAAHDVVEIGRGFGRVLAEPVLADRDYPPFDRSTRDGYGARSADVAKPGASLELVGEIKAGDTFSGTLAPGQCVQIMTGAALPRGADAVVMIEHTRPEGKRVHFERAGEPGQNVVPRGSEAREGQTLLEPGAHMGYAELALAAQVGKIRFDVFRRPRVAILSTGDEVVPMEAQPGPFQIRNSNVLSLAAQSALAGAEPLPLGNAPDHPGALRVMIEQGLSADILVLSGGVSVGKYDLVESVLRELGAEFFFDAVAIRPGRPAVFGICRNKFVFGLPGNPVSTMVTFELFVVPAIDWLGGAEPRPLPLFKARLAAPVHQKAALTHFLPAELAWEAGDPVVRELPWQGSGDIVAVARAACFLVVRPEKLELAGGDWVDVLPRRGLY